MVAIREKIDKAIKEVWLNEICHEYGVGNLIREASLQCSLYHHLRNKLDTILKENNLCLYPEFYFKDLKYRADLAIVEAIELDSEIYAVGFKKGSDLTAKVNDAIKTLNENGKLMEIATKYGFENVLSVTETIE